MFSTWKPTGRLEGQVCSLGADQLLLRRPKWALPYYLAIDVGTINIVLVSATAREEMASSA